MSEDIGALWIQRGADYAIAVRDGAIPACVFVKLAVERWFDDLKNAHKRGLFFSEDAAAKYFRFVGRYCKHYIGEFDGQLIELEPWQCFIEMNVHGWLREDGSRRFRIVYEEVGRKNGKSTRLAASGDYYLIADNEPGAQVYIAATKREQTKEIFSASAEMIRKSGALRACSH